MPYLYITVSDSQGIDNLYFDSLSQLKYLDLSNCTIDVLPEQIFRANTMLEELRKENIRAMLPNYNNYIYMDIYRDRYLHKLRHDMYKKYLFLYPYGINIAFRSFSRLARNPFKLVPISELYSVRSSLKFLDLSETDLEVR